MSVLAGVGLNYILSINKKQAAGIIILLLFFGYPAALAVRFDYLLTQKDTRTLALEWIKENINPKDRIATKFEDIKLLPTKQAIIDQRGYNHKSLRSDDYIYMKIHENDYPEPAFNVLRLHFIENELPENMKNNLAAYNYKYFAIEYWQPENISDYYKNIISNTGWLVKSFKNEIKGSYLQDINGNYYDPVYWLFKVDRLGPVIEIYKF